MVSYRTRFSIVFIYWESENKKCLTDRTPFIFRRKGVEDGDSYKYWKNFAKGVAKTIPKKCIITKPTTFSRVVTGVCIIRYIVKEPFVYHAKIQYIFKKRKDGIPIAFKVNLATGKKQQINFRTAVRRNKSQKSRVKTSTKKYIAKKKIVVDQFSMYRGCYSKDVKYKPGYRRSG